MLEIPALGRQRTEGLKQVQGHSGLCFQESLGFRLSFCSRNKQMLYNGSVSMRRGSVADQFSPSMCEAPGLISLPHTKISLPHTAFLSKTCKRADSNYQSGISFLWSRGEKKSGINAINNTSQGNTKSLKTPQLHSNAQALTYITRL